MTDFFADLVSDDLDAPSSNPHKQIARQAQETFPCQSCAGTGKYRGVRVHQHEDACFSCGGRGFHKLSPAERFKRNEKRKATIAQKAQDACAMFDQQNPGIRQFLSKAAEWSNFAASMLDQLASRNSLSEKQLAAVRSMMAKQAERDAERAAAKTTNLGDISALEALFGAVAKKGHTSPVYRAEGLKISLAPAHGRNAGALYVKDGGEYAGKIVGGKFVAVSTTKPDVKDRLLLIASDPKGVAIQHGKKTGECCLCGRRLTDPVSVANGIGPICAEGWGF